MSAPTEPRHELVQDALVVADLEFQKLFGEPATWSGAVWMEYRRDQHIARRRATNWGEAA